MSLFPVGVFPNAKPGAGFEGGLMIGLAGVMMLLGVGRIAGVSGLTARVARISVTGAPYPVALAFILGMPLGTAIIAMVAGSVNAHFFASPMFLLISGLAVGFGTLLGGGCTSGHGVCGLSRFSRRSIFAVVTFMGTAMATVAVINALGLYP
jgi:uncharacterized membrane protein YedE/YeeE